MNETATIAASMIVFNHTVTRFDIDTLYNVSLYDALCVFLLSDTHPPPMTALSDTAYTLLYITNFLK